MRAGPGTKPVPGADYRSGSAEGATKANSGIVHAGYDALPGTKKALYNVRGARMYEALCDQLGVPYSRCGALIIAFDGQDRETLNKLLDRGLTNGVEGMRIVERERGCESLRDGLRPGG